MITTHQYGEKGYQGHHPVADYTAAHTAAQPAVPALQRKSAEDEELQLKSVTQLATPEEDELQMKSAGPNNAAGEVSQRKDKDIPLNANHTGMPDHLKSGIENLSGYSMDDVKVHYNSSRPSQLNALAYAQGTDIHIAPGQERHLPHEAWHVVQQKQGRVRATMQMKGGINVNDDRGLEKEADVIGEKLAASELVYMSQPKEDSSIHIGHPLKHITDIAIQRKLTNGSGGNLGEDSINKLKTLFEYRHGKNDLENFEAVIRHHQGQANGITLNDLVNELLSNTSEEKNKWIRVGHLLKLILHQFQDGTGTERNELAGDKAWDDFAFATKIIRDWVAKFPLLNNPGIDEEEQPLLHPQPSKFQVPTESLKDVLKIGEDQWQAASVAARRAGWLTGIGFLELKQALRFATQGAIKLRLSRDIIHEGLESGPSDMVKVGTVNIPKYATTEKALNEGLSFFSTASLGRSGEYISKFGIILKHLDIGHKVVDIWENWTHRTKGRHVDEKVNFEFLALLSPKESSQKVIGANGQVLGDGSYMFTIDPSFRIRYMPAANYVGEGGTAKNFFQFIPHSQLASLGAVAAAGNFAISEGSFKWVDNGSGHYRVNPSVNTSNAKAALINLGYDTSKISFLSRGDGDLDEIYKKGNKFLEGLPKGEDRPAMTREIVALQKAMDQMH